MKLTTTSVVAGLAVSALANEAPWKFWKPGAATITDLPSAFDFALPQETSPAQGSKVDGSGVAAQITNTPDIGTGAGTGSSSGSGYGSSSGSSSGLGSGLGAGSGSESGSKPGSGSGAGHDLDVGKLGFSVGSNGIGIQQDQPSKAAASAEKIVATGLDALTFALPTPTVVKLAAAPVYTELADGLWGAAEDVIADLIAEGMGLLEDVLDGDLPGSASDDAKDAVGGLGDLLGSLGGSHNAGSKTNGTSKTGGNTGVYGGSKASTNSSSSGGVTAADGAAPAPGSAGSNVTAPFAAMQESGCNSALDRSLWCDGQSILSDVYSTPSYKTGKTVQYTLTLTNTTLNQDGVDVPVLAVNGQSPGPVIEANWGDMVEVTVINNLQTNGTSIHWHGLRQVNNNGQDGVPGVTECPLAPGQSRTYKWLADSYGTSWYHSHWGTQYGDGVLGPIVIHGPATANYDIDAGVVTLQDTYPMTAAQWNWITTHQGPVGTTNYLINGHNTKADLSAGQHSLWTVQKGKKYLFRLINSAAQNMFSVSVDNHKMTVIAADFVPIVPYQTEWLNIAVGQRYDVIIDMDQKVDSYFLRAVTQTKCPSSCTNTGLGQANGIIAYEGVPSDPYYLPTTTTTKKLADFDICNDEPLASLVPKLPKSGGDVATFQKQVATLPAGSVSKVDTNGNGQIFRWYLNNGYMNIDYTQPTVMTVADHSNATLISNAVELDNADQWYYFVIQNQYNAGHPMHLHGHDFAILGQGQGTFGPSNYGSLNFVNPMRRDTAMLEGATDLNQQSPTGYTVIGFQSDNPGAWLMHCHIAWHVDGGLSLQWVERPQDMVQQDLVTSEFRDQCSAYGQWQSQSLDYQKAAGMSGLRRRSSSVKQYLEHAALKRGVGHSHGHH